MSNKNVRSLNGRLVSGDEATTETNQDGTNSLTWVINEDTTGSPAEDGKLVIKSANGTVVKTITLTYDAATETLTSDQDMDLVQNLVATVTTTGSSGAVAGDALMDSAAGVVKANATSDNARDFLGFAASNESGTSITVYCLKGQEVTIAGSQIDGESQLTAGEEYFLATTSGLITKTPPTTTTGAKIIKVGKALSTTVLRITYDAGYRATVGGAGTTGTGTGGTGGSTDGSLQATTGEAITKGDAVALNASNELVKYNCGLTPYALDNISTISNTRYVQDFLVLDSSSFVMAVSDSSNNGYLILGSFTSGDASAGVTYSSSSLSLGSLVFVQQMFLVSTDKVFAVIREQGNNKAVCAVFDTSASRSTGAPVNLTTAANGGNNVDIFTYSGAFHQSTAVDFGQTDRFVSVWRTGSGSTGAYPIYATTHADGTATISSGNLSEDDTMEVNGNNYIAKASPPSDSAPNYYYAIGAASGNTATNLASKIESVDGSTLHASASGDVVTITAITGDETTGNAITLTSSTANITVSGSGTLTGGDDDIPYVGGVLSLTDIQNHSTERVEIDSMGLAGFFVFARTDASMNFRARKMAITGFDTLTQSSVNGQLEGYSTPFDIGNNNFVRGPFDKAKIGNDITLFTAGGGYGTSGKVALVEVNTSPDVCNQGSLTSASAAPWVSDPQRITVKHAFSVSQNFNIQPLSDDLVVLSRNVIGGSDSISENTSYQNDRPIYLASRVGPGRWNLHPATSLRWLLNAGGSAMPQIYIIKKLEDGIVAVINNGNTTVGISLLEYDSIEFAGIAKDNYTSGTTGEYFPEGTVANVFTGLTRHKRYYADGKSGELKADVNTASVGVAVSTTALKVERVNFSEGM